VNFPMKNGGSFHSYDLPNLNMVIVHGYVNQMVNLKKKLIWVWFNG
jgi:hypothetical protein